MNIIKKRLEDRIKNLEKLKSEFKNFSEIKIDNKKININEYGDALKEKYMKELNIIPTPKNKDKLFNEIFSMALQKHPPFSSEKKLQIKDLKMQFYFYQFLNLVKIVILIIMFLFQMIRVLLKTAQN